jgi:hypothetical protein
VAEKDNGLPESWRRAEAARRVLRKSSARATEASPLPDPARKLRSSLKHFKQEVPGPKDGKLIKTVFESRGIRRSTRRVYNDPVEKLGQALFSWTPTDTFETLYKKANRHLRACKYQDILEVIGLADAMAQNEGLEAASPEVVSRHLDLWVTQIEEQTGSLSIETAAARFLRAHDRVALHLSEQSDDRMTMAAIQAYADAWHWFHLEYVGEHDLAYRGEQADRGKQSDRSSKGLRLGPESKARTRKQKDDFIEQIYSRHLQDGKSEGPKRDAQLIRPAVVAKFEDEQFSKSDISLDTLEKKIYKIRAASRTKMKPPKRKKG